MLNSEKFVILIQKYWSDSAQRTGTTNVHNIVDDVLAGYKDKKFKVPEGGHHISIIPDLSVILEAATFLLALAQFIRELMNDRKEEKEIEYIKKFVEIYAIQNAKEKAKHLSEDEIRQIVLDMIESELIERKDK